MKQAQTAFNLSKLAISMLALMIIGSLVWQPGVVAHAQTLTPTDQPPILTITHLTWNTVALDEDDEGSGSNTFPVGARICNSGEARAQNLTLSFLWDSTNANINLVGPTSFSLAQLDGTQCQDYFFQVQINRTADSYDSSREFHFRLTAAGLTTIETESNTEIYVQPFTNEDDIGGNDLGSFTISGPTQIQVGQTVEFTASSSIASPGVQQLMQLIEMNPTLFRIISITSSYDTPTPTPTPTRISTITRTPTFTASFTHTPTITQSSTNTSTSTQTFTPTITPTDTEIGTPTATGTETDTPTATGTETGTPTITPTVTETGTPIITPTDDINPALASTPDRRILSTPGIYSPNSTPKPPSGFTRLSHQLSKLFTLYSTSTNYMDACGWDSDIDSPTYQTCIGPPGFLGGLAFGNTTVTYRVQAIAIGTAVLIGGIYTYSGGAYVYQPNSPSDALTVSIVTQLPGSQTPTITGTITPNPAITNAVSPSEARVGSNFTFTIRVTNNGSAPATNVTVRSSYSTYETISSANSSKGTTNTSASTRTVTGNIGNLAPGESATVTVVTRVSTSATSTVTLTNAATVTYRYNNNNFSRTSNSVTYRVTGSSTLPSTGFMEADPPSDGPAVTAGWIGGLLALLGIGALGYSFYARKHNAYWTDWFVKTGAALLVIGLVFGWIAWSLRPAPDSAPLAQLLATPPEDYSRTPYRPNNPPEAPVIDPEYPFPGGPDELESLPDFVIPTPTVDITPAVDGSVAKPPDTTAITRLVIPALGVDNVVKYVPYDGATWLISGLQDEIAWMGDTSWPGLGSNTALAAHVTLRDGSDGPFRNLTDLMAGDIVKVYTEENVYTYQVREQRLVNDYDLSPVSASETSQLTLITCSGWDSEIRLYISRLVIASDLVEVNPLDRAVAEN